MARVRNNSKKRDAILAKIRSTNIHPTAEWIYHELKSEYPDLSLGTVYRNLSLFKEEGQIISVGTVRGQERFDAYTAPHAHFLCNECGAVIDVDAEVDSESIHSQVNEKYGFAVDSHELTFHGICKRCLEARECL